jgi:His-Xaa-Ser system radical SAM maturase HxsB
VRRVEAKNDGRAIRFVICTNLAPLTDEILSFAKDHEVYFSTSLDGPQALHDTNRPRESRDGYRRVVEGIQRIRDTLGIDRVSALMTTTAQSLQQPEAIVDEYVNLGLTGIFLRPIRPYGFAARTEARLGYEPEAFVEFYKRALAYILDRNAAGVSIKEFYTTLLLQVILTPFPPRYVDLQSPTGAGTATLVYNYDGAVYASDEGRMLAEMNDRTFCLGTVQNSFSEIIANPSWMQTLHETMLEGVPGCCDCAFLPYCGSDPVYHHHTQGDLIGHKPSSSFCIRQKAILRHLISMLEAPTEYAKILRSWV